MLHVLQRWHRQVGHVSGHHDAHVLQCRCIQCGLQQVGHVNGLIMMRVRLSRNAYAFNADISEWDTSTVSIEYLFLGCGGLSGGGCMRELLGSARVLSPVATCPAAPNEHITLGTASAQPYSMMDVSATSRCLTVICMPYSMVMRQHPLCSAWWLVYACCCH